ncbi:MAG: helix-turn-helix transcriptional regulator [Calditrichaeota bacterium]|nr:helix-turn-helix transcriptional regulator [Calditrichota bacterium]
METLGERIQFLLKKNGLRARDLAKGVNLPETTISNIINNKFEPGVNKIKKIAEFFDVDLHWLITGHIYLGKTKRLFDPGEPTESGAEDDPLQDLLPYSDRFLEMVKKLDHEYQEIIFNILRSLNELIYRFHR